MALRNLTALVTGSTSGIGFGIARDLAKNGANIIFNGFGVRDQIEAMCQETSKMFDVKTHFAPADISKPEEIRSMVNEAQNLFGTVDILVNNAGIQHTSPIHEFPEEKWDQVIAINLSGAFHASKAVLPSMVQNGYGRIINVASVHGLVASKNKSAYVAAKHGLIGMSKVKALEYARTPVTINCIAPGWVLTPLVQKQIDDLAAERGISVQEAQEQLLSEKQPSLRFTTPEQLGELATFLCSHAASNITGQTIAVDGGWTAQ